MRTEQSRSEEARGVTVVTRTRDRPLMLERALASGCGQGRGIPIHWVIVNDGGERNAVDAVASRSSLRTTVVHRATSSGMEAASNAGLALAGPGFVCIHDDDDTWHPDFVAECTTYLDANGWCQGVISGTEFVLEAMGDGVVREVSRGPWRPGLRDAPEGAVQIADMVVVNQFPPIAFMYRSEVLADLGGYDEGLPVLGDWEFNLRFLSRHEIGVVGRTLARYHCRPGTPGGSYGNSVSAGLDRHRKHDALLRNRLIRSAKDWDGGILALLLATGHVQGAIIRQADTATREQAAALTSLRRSMFVARGIGKALNGLVRPALSKLGVRHTP